MATRDDKPMSVEELAAYARRSDRWTNPRWVLGPLAIIVGVLSLVAFAILTWQHSPNQLAIKVTVTLGVALVIEGLLVLCTGRTSRSS